MTHLTHRRAREHRGALLPRAPRARRAGRTRARIAGWTTLWIGGACLVASAAWQRPQATSAGDGAKSATGVEDTRSTLEEWVETRRAISKERRDWVLGKELLTEQAELVQQEIEAFRGRIDETQGQIDAANAKVENLVARRAELETTSATLTETVLELEASTRALLARLPEPLRERVRPLSQRIPPAPGSEETEGAPRLSVSQRFESVVGVLNEVNRFHKEISVASEVRTLNDGTTLEVTALYVGIGQGYYVNASGTVAGRGHGTEDGWEWVEDNAFAEAVARAIAITKGELAAEYVPLPVQIQ